MKRILLSAASLGLATQAYAGGQLDTFKFTGQSNFIPGFEDVEIVPIFWDTRCTNVVYTADTIPATGASGPIPPSVWVPEMAASFNEWNKIKTSFIKMTIGSTQTLGNGTIDFDFINELTFETPVGSGFLASSPSVSLEADATFVAGDDIDGDGDSDVFTPATPAQNVCQDIDADGDNDFPAGNYLAGTILENDVQFNDRLAPSIVWETTPSSTPLGAPPAYPFILPRKTDIQAVAIHEFGHSHGLAHSFINQISTTDGTGATMFPFIDIDDRFSEIGQRTLHDDDIAWSSYVYPEGSAASGPGALQDGDKSFTANYKIVSGSYTKDGFGVLGGNIAGLNSGNSRVLSSAYSGKARAFSPDGFNVFVGSLSNSIISDQYKLPVPNGTYRLPMQALDGDPAATGNISITAQIGGILGQHVYPEEFRSAPGLESDFEDLPGRFGNVNANANVSGVNVQTNRDLLLRNTGPVTNIGTAAAFDNNVIYAERYNNADVLALLNAGAKLTTGLFRTGVFDASVVGVFKRAGLFYGTINTDGTANINLTNPIFAQNEFVGQDGDTTPLFLEGNVPGIQAALTANPNLHVFLVLEAKNAPNFNKADDPRPPLLGLRAVAGTGKSYLSTATVPAFTPQTTRNWAVELRFRPAS